jgi:hypothetical protein
MARGICTRHLGVVTKFLMLRCSSPAGSCGSAAASAAGFCSLQSLKRSSLRDVMLAASYRALEPRHRPESCRLYSCRRGGSWARASMWSGSPPQVILKV